MILFLILIIIASLVLAFMVLIQNPKGGGLSGSIGGFSNQFMGVKQTTDVLEKGTWTFAAIIGVLCLFSSVFIPKTGSRGNLDMLDQIKTNRAPMNPIGPGTGDTNNSVPFTQDSGAGQ